MKLSAKFYIAFLTVAGSGISAVHVSAGSLRSPRHGQETVDVSGGPTNEPAAPMGMMHHGDGGQMMGQGRDMEMMQNCRERMASMESMPMPGKMEMGHRSNMHAQMRNQMRDCMARMNSGERGPGGMMMRR